MTREDKMEEHPTGKWKHRRDDYMVAVVSLGHLKVKDAGDANWSEAVSYCRYDEGDNDSPFGSIIYVRARGDFLEKFELVDA